VDTRFDEVKRLTIIALVSSDELMEKLVLKGGNAIRIVAPNAVRQSLDLDFSLDGELDDVGRVRTLAERLLSETFAPAGLTVFDMKLDAAPPKITKDTVGEFWGGYILQFKVMPREQFDGLSGRPQKRQIQALELGPGGRRVFTVDISHHEYCVGKEAHDFDGYRVYVYTPLMIVCEKVRAICQQMPAYRKLVRSHSARPRARDFFDIHFLMTRSAVDLREAVARETLRRMFEAKRVPLALLGRISEEREYHRENFASVRATVAATHLVEGFDFYVDFLVERLRPLEACWIKEAPPL
jgi:predicted nucleotidyltransferase component of viral defense system